MASVKKRRIEEISKEEKKSVSIQIFQLPFPKSLLRPCLTKIISGGQTGADLAGLMAASALGIETGGWAPYRFMNSNGSSKALLHDIYGLEEIPYNPWHSTSISYVMRSKKNVDDADATLVFKIQASTGTDKTIGYAQTGKWQIDPKPGIYAYKPVMIIQESVHPSFKDGFEQIVYPSDVWIKEAEALYLFLSLHKVKVLNIAGHSQSKSMDLFWQQRVYHFLLFALQRMRRNDGVVIDNTDTMSSTTTP